MKNNKYKNIKDINLDEYDLDEDVVNLLEKLTSKVKTPMLFEPYGVFSEITYSEVLNFLIRSRYIDNVLMVVEENRLVINYFINTEYKDIPRKQRLDKFKSDIIANFNEGKSFRRYNILDANRTNAVAYEIYSIIRQDLMYWRTHKKVDKLFVESIELEERLNCGYKFEDFIHRILINSILPPIDISEENNSNEFRYFVFDKYEDSLYSKKGFSVYMKTNKQFDVAVDKDDIIKEAVNQNLMSKYEMKYCTDVKEIDKDKYYDSIKYGI